MVNSSKIDADTEEKVEQENKVGGDPVIQDMANSLRYLPGSAADKYLA